MQTHQLLMHNMLNPLLNTYPDCQVQNERVIRNLTLQLMGSWKIIFLSGGPFDILKPIVRFIRLDSFFKNILLHK